MGDHYCCPCCNQRYDDCSCISEPRQPAAKRTQKELIKSFCEAPYLREKPMPKAETGIAPTPMKDWFKRAKPDKDNQLQKIILASLYKMDEEIAKDWDPNVSLETEELKNMWKPVLKKAKKLVKNLGKKLMEQLKELQSLQRKGLMVGNKCEIVLLESIGYRDHNNEYVRFAEKGATVKAQIVKRSMSEFNGIAAFLVKGPTLSLDGEPVEIWVDLDKGRARSVK